MFKFTYNLIIFCLIGIVIVKGLEEGDMKAMVLKVGEGCKAETGASDC